MNVTVAGPKVLFSLPGGIQMTETVVNTWAAMAIIVLFCLWLTRNMSVRNPSKRQLAAEKLYTLLTGMVKDTMGKQSGFFVIYIGSLFAMSMTGSLLSLIGLRPPTADLSVTAAFALISFGMTQLIKIRGRGIGGWLKSFTQPVAVITPLNLISELASPISMAFRHFGNVASGVVISSLVYGALMTGSEKLFGWIPNQFLASVPWLAAGIPAVLSIYFDVFTAFLQAYIICMLTMVFAADSD